MKIECLGPVDCRERGLLSHELAHVHHQLRFGYNAQDLNDTANSTLSDLVFHPYVYSMQVDCGVSAERLADSADRLLHRAGNAFQWLNTALSFLTEDAALERARSLEEACRAVVEKVIEVVAPAYDFDLEFNAAAKRLREVHEIILGEAQK